MSDLSEKYQFNECGCTFVRGCFLHTDEGRLRLAALTHVPDPEMDRIADEATEMQVLAAACLEEGWRINKSEERWFAEKPCTFHAAGVDLGCACACHVHFRLPCEECARDLCKSKRIQCDRCKGAAFERAGKKS